MPVYDYKKGLSAMLGCFLIWGIQPLVMGSGIVTAAPMLLYAVGVRNLPLMTSGICQYLSPTLGIFCGLILGESLTKEKLVSFCFIWAGVILYTLNSIYEEKKRGKTAA